MVHRMIFEETAIDAPFLNLAILLKLNDNYIKCISITSGFFRV